jgi:branched-chain amino acid transport system ATP-binding protein
VLKIRNLVANYGHIEALHGISLDVSNKEMVALIGSNGAGKSTLLNAISGHVTKTGEINYNDIDIGKMKAGKIVKQGIIQVPEGRHVFPGLTVMQNLIVGTIAWRGLGKADIEEDLEKVTTLFPRLKERYKQLTWSLSGGEQQMVAMGRAMMGRPKLLMLDEPSMGLAPKVVDEMFDAIVAINKSGTPILLVEQNALLALEVSSKAYIIEGGKIKFSGTSQELASDDRVREAYLGKTN